MVYKASVSIMRSYDYSHFEVQLGTDEELTIEQINDMRKEAMRLVDKAVKQYQIARNREKIQNQGDSFTHKELQRKVQIIVENYPQSEWTPAQKAIVKELNDFEFAMSHGYDYEDEDNEGF